MSRREINFDSVARIYRWAEYLAMGSLLQRTRDYFLASLDDRREALVLGDGDGRFLAALLRRNPGIRARAVDSSAAMLEVLSERCVFARERVVAQQASLVDILPGPDTDLLVTHFVLDCFDQADVDGIAKRMAGTKAGTLWVVSDFGLPRWRLLRPFGRLYLWGLYLAFAVLTGLRVRSLPDPPSSLMAAGFRRIARHETLNGFLYTELWQRNSGGGSAIHFSKGEGFAGGDSAEDDESGCP